MLWLGLASFMMILEESNIIVLGLAKMKVCIFSRKIEGDSQSQAQVTQAL